MTQMLLALAFAATPDAEATTFRSLEVCGDRIDNDGDGAIDEGCTTDGGASYTTRTGGGLGFIEVAEGIDIWDPDVMWELEPGEVLKDECTVDGAYATVVTDDEVVVYVFDEYGDTLAAVEMDAPPIWIGIGLYGLKHTQDSLAIVSESGLAVVLEEGFDGTKTSVYDLDLNWDAYDPEISPKTSPFIAEKL